MPGTIGPMPFGTVVYTARQREALAAAAVDRKIPPKRVAEMARAGELTFDGESLAAFETNPNTVRDLARKMRARRAGKIKGDLAGLAPRDAVESLRLRLLNVVEQELRAEEVRKRGNRDPERIRQFARAAREIAAIPARDDPRPVAPGQKIPGTQATNGGRTRGGLAGQILASAGQGARVETHETSTAHDVLEPTTDGGDSTARSTERIEHEHDVESDEPGAWARAQVAHIAGTEPNA
jgi:hypothetical protein